jgi:hypothetical protein
LLFCGTGESSFLLFFATAPQADKPPVAVNFLSRIVHRPRINSNGLRINRLTKAKVELDWRYAPLVSIAFLMTLPLLGCQAHRQEAVLPSRDRLVRDQLVFFTNFRLAKRHRLVDELAASRDSITEALNLPVSDEPINIYLFKSEPEYRAFMAEQHPQLPDRRAFFVKSDTEMQIFAYWGDRVGEDLQHEVTHGYLHSVVPNIPLWLDEGLAEFFEVGRGQHGFNRSHILSLAQEFRKGEWKPDLKRLESLSDAANLSQDEYAECWLWVHFLLESDNNQQTIVQDQLARLRMAGEAPPLSDFVEKEITAAHENVVAHLKKLAEEL